MRAAMHHRNGSTIAGGGLQAEAFPMLTSHNSDVSRGSFGKNETRTRETRRLGTHRKGKKNLRFVKMPEDILN